MAISGGIIIGTIYETWQKMDDRKWIFVGWLPITNEFLVSKKEYKKFIYVTYKYLDGTVAEYKFRK